MNGHTPGPWHLCAHLADGDKCSCGYRGGIYGVDREHMVCEMGSTIVPGEEGLEAPRYDRATEIANAHLIWAAPDLLEALQDCVDRFTTAFPASEEYEPIKRARAAISKATNTPLPATPQQADSAGAGNPPPPVPAANSEKG